MATIQELQHQAEINAEKAHSDAIEAGKLLADAQEKAAKAADLMEEANIRLSNARKFEEVLKKRQEKLDRAFSLLNKERRLLQQRNIKADERELMLGENTRQY